MIKHKLRNIFNLNISFKISLSFYIIILVCIFFKIVDIFLYSFIFVFLHEITHIIVAKKFGIKCKKVFVTPIGQIAILDKLERLSKNKKIIIACSGIVLNLIFAFIFSFFTSDKMQLIKNINLSIAFFNILPIYPLDGGRILQYYLGSKIGDLKASYVIKKISTVISLILFLLGFLQIIFIPYNISLFCLGLYFIKINKNEYIKFTFEFYRNIIDKREFEKDRIMEIRKILVNKETLNKDIILKLSQDYNTIIYVSENGDIITKIWEKDFINYIEKNGLNDRIYDIYLYYLNNKYS